MIHRLREHWTAAAVITMAAIAGVALYFSDLREPAPAPASIPSRGAVEPPQLAIDLPAASPVRGFLSTAASTGHGGAIGALASLPETLTATEQRLLIEFLSRGLPGFDRLPPAGCHHIANDLMMVILRQEEPWRGFVTALGQIAGDPGHDPVVRDYALQAIGRWLADRGAVAASPENVQPAVSALLSAASQSGWSSSGTALIALDYSQIFGGGSAPQALAQRQGEYLGAIDSITRSTGAHPSARTSAFQIASRLRRPGLAAHARAAATDTSMPASVRASALAALGEVGDPATDTPILEACSGDPHLQISSAGASALLKLADRL